MVEPNKPCNDREKKKMVVKLGGGVGSGIGAVILLGGALATAALTSAFIVGKRGRSSGKDLSRHHRNPLPKFTQLQNEADKEEQYILRDEHSDARELPSSGAADEVKLEKDAALRSLIMDENPGIEISGGKPGDQILCSISSQKQENDTNCSVNFEEKFKSFEPERMMHEIKIQSTGKSIISDISEDMDDFKETYIDKEITDEEYNGDGEIKEISHEKAVNGTKILSRIEDNTDECSDQERTELTVVDKYLDNGHIDEMGAELNMQVEVIMNIKDLNAIHGDSEGIIREVKCEEVIEKPKLGVGAVADGEEKVMNDMEATEINDVQAKEEETTEACFYQEKLEVTVTENVVNGVPIDQVEAAQAGDKSTMEVNNGEKQLEGCWSHDIEMDEVKCGEAIEETNIDVAEVGLELGEEGPGDIEEAKSSDISASDTIQDAQENVQPVVESPVIEHRNIGGDKEENFVTSEVAVKNDEGIYDRETLLPTCDSPLIEHDKKEGNKPIQIVERTLEGKITEGCREKQVKPIEEQLVDELKDSYQTDEEIVPEKCEEVELRDVANQNFLQTTQLIEENEEKTSQEENACTENPTPGNWHFGENEKNVQVLAKLMLTEELISPEKVEATKKDAADEEVAKSLEVKDHNIDAEGNHREETEDSSEIIDMNIAKAADNGAMETTKEEGTGEEDDCEDCSSETDISDEVEESSVGTGDSSTGSISEAVWSAELKQEPSVEPQQTKPINQEVDAKIFQENTTVEEEDSCLTRQTTAGDSFHESHQVKAVESDLLKSTESATITTDSKGDIKMTNFANYRVEMASLKNHMTNSTRWRMLIATLSVVSSLSCSWFFGLSFVKLCLIVSLTMVLSIIHKY